MVILRFPVEQVYNDDIRGWFEGGKRIEEGKVLKKKRVTKKK
jgi:hypothetical protein